MIKATRRHFLAAGGAAALPLPFIGRAQAAQEIPIAMLVPLSGPWAYNGNLKKLGATMAVEDINKAGGIRALGGAKLVLRMADAGGSVEEARAAAQRLVSQQPDLVAGIGAWLSSFTLAVTEVTERAKLPWLSQSWADSITNRGFKYIILTSAPSSQIVTQSFKSMVELAKATTGKAPETVAIISDNTASQVAILDTLRGGLLKDIGLKPVMDQVFSPPLADSSNLVMGIRQARPDLVLLNTSVVSNSKLLLQTMKQFGLGGGRIPVFAPVSNWGFPVLRETIGVDAMEGLMGAASDWGMKREHDLLESMNARSGLPWQPQEPLQAYGHVNLIASAIETAASTDRDKVMEALHATDTSTGPAKYFLGDHLSFLPSGRRRETIVALYQWQNGVPVLVSPADEAVAPLRWHTPA